MFVFMTKTSYVFCAEAIPMLTYFGVLTRGLSIRDLSFRDNYEKKNVGLVKLDSIWQASSTNR